MTLITPKNIKHATSLGLSVMNATGSITRGSKSDSDTYVTIAPMDADHDGEIVYLHNNFNDSLSFYSCTLLSHEAKEELPATIFDSRAFGDVLNFIATCDVLA